MRSKTSKLISVVAAFGCLTSSVPAQATFWDSCCGDRVRWFGDATFKLLNQAHFQPGAAARLRFEESIAAYNGITGSSFDWSVVQDNDNTLTSDGDGTEAGFMAANAPDWGVLGTASIRWGVCGWPFCDEEISEADIKFYLRDLDGTPYPWDFNVPTGSYFTFWNDDPGSDLSKAPLIPLYFGPVAAHEIGHSTGLAHTNVVHASGLPSRMGAAYPNGGWFHAGNQRVGPLAYDCDQVRTLYPTSGSAADVYASSFRGRPNPDRTGPVTADPNANNNTQAQKHTYPFNSTADRDPSDANQIVFPGDVVKAKVCVGNLGNASTGALSLDFFLSIDQTITTTSDFRSPSTNTVTFGGSGFGGCDTDYTFTVPTGVARNTWYYVGAWINRGSNTSAVTDNVTVLNRRLRVGNYP